MKKVFILTAIIMSGLVATSCSSNEDEIPETSAKVVTVSKQDEVVRNGETIPVTKTVAPPNQTFSDGADDEIIPPKKP